MQEENKALSHNLRAASVPAPLLVASYVAPASPLRYTVLEPPWLHTPTTCTQSPTVAPASVESHSAPYANKCMSGNSDTTFAVPTVAPTTIWSHEL